jgi:hypothetical protein
MRLETSSHLLGILLAQGLDLVAKAGDLQFILAVVVLLRDIAHGAAVEEIGRASHEVYVEKVKVAIHSPPVDQARRKYISHSVQDICQGRRKYRPPILAFVLRGAKN